MVLLEDCKSAIRFRKGRTILNMASTYNSAKRMMNNELANEPALTTAITAANKHQAVISSIAAHVIMVAPKGVLLIPLSCIMRAITGNAAILIAIPINKANGRNTVL